MDNPKISPLGTGVAYEADLPLQCRAIVALPDPADLAQIQNANTDLLKIIAALDDHAPELGEEDSAIAHELQRLDFKMNVLMSLISQIYLRQVQIPPAVPVRLTSQGIEWSTMESPSRNVDVRLEIYLNMTYPRPLILFGRTESTLPEGNRSRVQVQFLELGDSVQDWLEKIIFRHHRRHVALTRRA